MELIAGDAGVFFLAVIADFGDEAAEPVVLGHSLSEGFVGNVRAEDIVKGLQHLFSALGHIEIETVLVGLHGDLQILEEEIIAAHGLQKLHVLHAAVDHGAAVRGDKTVQKLVASLQRPLQQGTGVFAEETGHVVGAHFHGAGAGSPQTYRENARQLHEHFRDLVADGADTLAALCLRCTDEFVVGVRQQLLKGIEMLQIFHMASSLYL